MYDWNALWHENAGFRTGSDLTQEDLNGLEDALSATLFKAARDETDVAVYETPDRFILLGYQDGLQMLEVAKHTLFDLTLRVVTEDEGQGMAPPYLEALIDNLATGESGEWRGVLTLNPDGIALVNGQALSPELLPDMLFPELAFTQTPHFRDQLAGRWREELTAELPMIEAALSGGADEGSADVGLPPARMQQIYDRYAEMVRREQANLSRVFTDAELQLVAALFKGVTFESAASCRGLWLVVEAQLIDQEPDRELQVDALALLEKMKGLSYAQEVALIEGLLAS
ncbi:hypothetical protein [Crenobacter cavernae]|uniref:Uncharacterized protein n=1 Tax=Crenobacter cavernae TaxID=2290923 RepID=A0A345Y8V6_9NEIS|nr:hypothetical protein [Crenobacter cavernae]AXK40358.1 hypothetical protein DWG20_13490 [Crenobacter cavernae]